MAILNRYAASLRSVERAARMCMGTAALLGATLGLCFKFGLVSTAPDYERQSWYLVMERGGFTVISVLEDEATCRKRESADAVCRSGSSLADRR